MVRSDRIYGKKTFAVLRTLKNTQGFSLIEVLLAMSILAVGLLGVATMQISAMRVNSTARDITHRATVAQNRLEILVGLAFDDPLLDVGPPQELAPDEDGYDVSWVVIDNADNADLPNNAKEITLTVARGDKKTEITYVKSKIAD